MPLPSSMMGRTTLGLALHMIAFGGLIGVAWYGGADGCAWGIMNSSCDFSLNK
jgi:hypothetical protein